MSDFYDGEHVLVNGEPGIVIEVDEDNYGDGFVEYIVVKMAADALPGERKTYMITLYRAGSAWALEDPQGKVVEVEHDDRGVVDYKKLKNKLLR